MNNVKKILIIGHTNVIGGVETFIRNTTINSDKSKVEFFFLVHGYKDCLFREEINKFYGNNHFYFIKTSIRKRPIKTTRSLIKFYKEHHDFDYIHLQTGSASEVLYAYPYKFIYNIKLITHSHNGGNLRSFFAHQCFVPLVNYCTDIKLSCSKLAAIYMFGKKQGDLAKVIPVGIDLTKFKFNVEKRKKFRKEYNFGENELLIGVIGRFTEQKNQFFALDIFQKIKEKNNRAILILKGEGELETKLKARAQILGIDSNMKIINRIDNMENLYSGIDVFLMPSLFEGLPQVAVEAQASGLPCVYSDTISKEIILTDYNKMLSLSDSLELWAKTVLDSNVPFEKREDCYRVLKEKKYDVSDTVTALEKVYCGE